MLSLFESLVFITIFHLRTDEEIDTENSVDVSSLRDPEPDTDRCQKPKWLVVVGVCTHLGCVPIADAGRKTYCSCW